MESANIPSVFGFGDYKGFLHAQIEAHRGTPSYKSRLASAMKAPASFLSQVLHTHVHLSLDHGMRLALFWNFTQDERDYFLDLINLARAGSPELRGMLESRLKALKQRNEDMSERFKASKVETSEQQWVYYSNWQLAAIHMLLTIPGFQEPRNISRKLGLSIEEAGNALMLLKELDLAYCEGSAWRATQKQVHLSRNSPVSPVNHWMWRQKAAQAMYRRSEQDFFYTGVHTLSRGDVEKLRSILLQTVDRAREVIAPSPEEELVCLSIDFFRV